MMARKKKVGIITFHASHNYGSMLQAYALQQTVIGMGYDCEIINFRTVRQREFYRPIFVRGSFIDKAKRCVFYAPYIYAWKKKHWLFERFLNEKYHLSREAYNTLGDLEKADLDCDIYISGSDQIWNTRAFDFDWAYLLPFAGNSRRVAYAPSMGPVPFQSISSEDKAARMAKLLSGYDHLSVRERQTMEKIAQLTNKDCVVTLDPTLLIELDAWSKMAGDTPLIKGDYIFLYTPWYDEIVYLEAERMSRRLKMPVVISLLHEGLIPNLKIMRKRFKCRLATGPMEFLNLCKFARYTVGRSFHLVAFSIIFRKPFYAIDGMKDSRVIDLLQLTGLEQRSVSSEEDFAGIPLAVDFDIVHSRLSDARERSLEWLRKSLS